MNALRAEWIKFYSLRSTWLTLAGLVVAGLGITFLSMSAIADSYPDLTAEERLEWDPTRLSLTLFFVVQLIIGVLGVLVVTSEYATGLLRTSLTATPRRHRLLLAKVAVVAAVAVVAGQVLMFAAFFLGQNRLSAAGAPHAALGDPHVLRAIVGTGLYLAVIALLAVALGTILRATAGALAALVAIVLLVPALADIFPGWLDGLFDFWPTIGGSAVVATLPDPAYPHPWVNLAGLAAGVAVLLAGAVVLFGRRDV
ncbi:ABC transporter permease [Actinoplanes sp. NBRC 14428]|uniref:ABC-2 family transporter n=1 Tax=Pseudosporangium ferrugineum TaxID=439699 RepID=A0A2T0SAX3_9ACTN|nr:ABC transporter permease [Pseudosporangium ferrugineum]PRY30531.1 ABC-2 family transporter [Pseudosporangium ferrugineum]BCJ50066.1 ABC transporter permease [Actinoplanes sp. NBRC 14428]